MKKISKKLLDSYIGSVISIQERKDSKKMYLMPHKVVKCYDGDLFIIKATVIRMGIITSVRYKETIILEKEVFSLEEEDISVYNDAIEVNSPKISTF